MTAEAKRVELGGHWFTIHEDSPNHVRAVPDDPEWMLKILYEHCEKTKCVTASPE